MDINLDINHNAHDNARFNIGLSSRYLPVQLSATSFGKIGDCVAFLANNADSQSTNIIVDDDSVLFIILWDQFLFDEIKKCVLKMDYWFPNYNFHRITGEVDGVKRTVYLDSRAFNKIVNPPQNSATRIRTISQFKDYDVLYPCVVFVSEDFRSVFNATPIFQTPNGFEIKNNSISAKVGYELLQYHQYKNNLACKSYTRYYDRYKVTNMLGTQYIIYSEEGFKLLRQYFFDTSDYATSEILSDKVVGAITILENPAFEDKINSITVFLTTEPIKLERCINIDMESSSFEDYPIKSLKPQATKVLTLAIIHAIVKKYNYQPENRLIDYELLGGWNDFLQHCADNGLLSDISSFMSMDKTVAKRAYEALLYDFRKQPESLERFIRFIESNFDSMPQEDKALCAFLIPKFKDLL